MKNVYNQVLRPNEDTCLASKRTVTALCKVTLCFREQPMGPKEGSETQKNEVRGKAGGGGVNLGGGRWVWGKEGEAS